MQVLKKRTLPMKMQYIVLASMVAATAADTFPLDIDFNNVENVATVAQNALREHINAKMRSLPTIFRHHRRHLASSPCVWKSNACKADTSYFESYVQDNANGVAKNVYETWKSCQLHADVPACNADKHCQYETTTKSCDTAQSISNKLVLTEIDDIFHGCDTPYAGLLFSASKCRLAPGSDCGSGGLDCKAPEDDDDDEYITEYEASSDGKSCVKVTVANSQKDTCDFRDESDSQKIIYGCEPGVDFNKLKMDCTKEIQANYPCEAKENCTIDQQSNMHDALYKCYDSMCPDSSLMARPEKCSSYCGAWEGSDCMTKCQADDHCEKFEDAGNGVCIATQATVEALYRSLMGDCKYTDFIISRYMCDHASGGKAGCIAKTTNGNQCEWTTETECWSSQSTPKVESECRAPSTADMSEQISVVNFVSSATEKCHAAKSEVDCTGLKIDLSKAPRVASAASAANVVEPAVILSTLSVFLALRHAGPFSG